MKILYDLILSFLFLNFLLVSGGGKEDLPSKPNLWSGALGCDLMDKSHWKEARFLETR